MIHDSRNSEDSADTAHHHARNLGIELMNNRLRRFTSGIGGQEVRGHGRKHNDNDSRDSKTCKQNGTGDIVTDSGTGNLQTDKVHPEACYRVCYRRHCRCARGLFHILSIIRNHRQPRKRQCHRNFKDIPEAERMFCSRCARRFHAEQLRRERNQKHRKYRHHKSRDLGKTTETHKNPNGNQHRQQHASEREGDGEIEARQNRSALGIQHGNPCHQLEQVQRCKKFGTISTVNRLCGFHGVQANASTDKAHKKQQNTAKDVAQNQRKPNSI